MKAVLIGLIYFLVNKPVLLYLRFTNPQLCRFYTLNGKLRRSLKARKYHIAEQLAAEYLELANVFPDDWNYGNAIHKANLAFGSIALDTGDVELAKEYLLKAGKTPGSPQLNSFGPNMSLAKQLLERGEKDVVLQYFDLCRTFWDMGDEWLKYWSESVKAGGNPNFGANIHY